MKLSLGIALLALLVIGCAPQGLPTEPAPEPTATITDIDQLILTEQDVQEIGISSDGCEINKFDATEYSPEGQYGMCNYTVTDLENTNIIMELHKFTDNRTNRDGYYQYSSLHMRGMIGIIEEDTYGELSRFYKTDESPIYYYNMWIAREDYVMHITSKGSEDADEYIRAIARHTMAKFE